MGVVHRPVSERKNGRIFLTRRKTLTMYQGIDRFVHLETKLFVTPPPCSQPHLNTTFIERLILSHFTAFLNLNLAQFISLLMFQNLRQRDDKKTG
jgi:hypothetical protein